MSFSIPGYSEAARICANCESFNVVGEESARLWRKAEPVSGNCLNRLSRRFAVESSDTCAEFKLDRRPFTIAAIIGGSE